MEKVLLKLIFKIYYNRLMTNLNIFKKILKKKYILSFYKTHVTCYIKFKLLYKFRIVTFFSF